MFPKWKNYIMNNTGFVQVAWFLFIFFPPPSMLSFHSVLLMCNSPMIWTYRTFWIQVYNNDIYFPYVVWDSSRVICSLRRFSHWKNLDKQLSESRETKKLSNRSHNMFYNSGNVPWFDKSIQVWSIDIPMLKFDF